LPRGPAEASGFRVEHWLDPSAIDDLAYAEYWNDEDVERGKEWYVMDGDFSPMERYLDEVGLVRDLQACLSEVEALRGRPIGGVGLDLAAGTLWAARHLLGAGPVDRLYCVEYSQHRLLKLGPVVLGHYGIAPERIVLALGSFYDLRVDDQSVDFAFMSQALHHADEPDRLLAELARTLRPDGVAMVIGEHIVAPGMYAGRAAGLAASWLLPERVQRRLFSDGSHQPDGRLVPDVDRVTGDHYYRSREYRRMFARHGFRHRRIRRRGGEFQGFVLWRLRQRSGRQERRGAVGAHRP
jgi:SAM-dependent methyltransferase